MKGAQKQFDDETTAIAQKVFVAVPESKLDPIEAFLEPLAPKILKPNGKLNLWYIVWNIGLIVARIVSTITINKKKKEND